MGKLIISMASFNSYVITRVYPVESLDTSGGFPEIQQTQGPKVLRGPVAHLRLLARFLELLPISLHFCLARDGGTQVGPKWDHSSWGPTHGLTMS